MKKIILLLPLLALALVGCDGELTAAPVVTDPNNEQKSGDPQSGDIIKILHLNDTHGSIEYRPDDNEPGMAYLAGYVNTIREQANTNVVLVSSGDMFQGSLDSNISQGKLMIDIMKEMRFDSMSIGNHEFDWGVDVLKENAAYAMNKEEGDWSFPFLSGNILNPEGQYDFGYLSTTFNRGPARVSVIGSIDNGVYDSIDGPIVEGYEFVNATSMVISEAQRLRQAGSDIIIYSTHDVDKRVDKSIADYVDAIFTGHSHHNSVLTMKNSDFKSVPIIESSSNGRAIGEVEFIYDSAKESYSLNGYKNTNLLNGSITLVEDEAVQSIYDAYLDAPAQDGPVQSESLRALKNDKIGEINSDSIFASIDGTISKLSVQQMFLQAQLDAYSESYDIIGSSYNESRSAWNVGDITYADVYKAFPFDNATVIVEATGKQLELWGTLTIFIDGLNKYSLEDNDMYQIVTSTYIINNREQNYYTSIIHTDADIFQRHVMYQQFIEASAPNPWN
ncbi:MAG: metallophosphoesterase [Bacilli bacterium]|jgi:2',3'-cyclic-nucleotide 2'-phosphodiesterase/3'-nucleotidase|nr:metallophosphoesterase [Bacilli bacterium]